jgi:hypothetical protein
MQWKEMTIMATPARMKDEYAARFCVDKVVFRLDAFPELTKALREGDLTKGRTLCARLFGCEPRQNMRPRGQAFQCGAK